MILPQLEADCHGVDVVGMFFFHDNTFALRDGDPLGSRLVDVAEEKDIHLMLCDWCASKRGLAEQVGTDESEPNMNHATPSMVSQLAVSWIYTKPSVKAGLTT